MIEGLELIFVFLVLPGALAWIAARFVRVRSAFVSPLAMLVSAALPSLWVFYETQQADGITRAASIVVTPVLFLLMLIPAGVGYAMGKARDQS